LKLYRKELASPFGLAVGEIMSKLTVVDMCGAEYFLKDSKKLILKEGIWLLFYNYIFFSKNTFIKTPWLGMYVSKTILGFFQALQNVTLVSFFLRKKKLKMKIVYE
jgi:hypothetical protein